MKKINLLVLIVAAFLGMTAISSCDPTTDAAKPTIDFLAEGGSIVADSTGMDTLKAIQFIINVDESIDTKKNLKTLKITSIKNNTTNVDTLIPNINSASAKYTFNFYTTNTNSTAEVFTFILTDKAGVSVSKKITLTTKDTTVIVPAANPINTYSATLLGAQLNVTEGSFLNVHTGTVMNISAANSAAGDIDFIYYFGTTNLATLVAPTDVTVNGGGTNLSLATGLSPQRETIMALSTTTIAEFDAMTDDADFPTGIAGSTKQNMLAIGDVVEFITHDGKIGLLKVTILNNGSAGDMTIDIKIQQ